MPEQKFEKVEDFLPVLYKAEDEVQKYSNFVQNGVEKRFITFIEVDKGTWRLLMSDRHFRLVVGRYGGSEEPYSEGVDAVNTTNYPNIGGIPVKRGDRFEVHYKQEFLYRPDAKKPGPTSKNFLPY